MASIKLRYFFLTYGQIQYPFPCSFQTVVDRRAHPRQIFWQAIRVQLALRYLDPPASVAPFYAEEISKREILATYCLPGAARAMLWSRFRCSCRCFLISSRSRTSSSSSFFGLFARPLRFARAAFASSRSSFSFPS